MRLVVVAVFAGLIGSAAPAWAQAAGTRPPADTIPTAYRPPPGMCRVWLDGVPANKQPAPTDCATAIKNRPANGRGRVIYSLADSVKVPRPGVPPTQPNRLPIKPPPVVRPPPPVE